MSPCPLPTNIFPLFKIFLPILSHYISKRALGASDWVNHSNYNRPMLLHLCVYVCAHLAFIHLLFDNYVDSH